MSRPAVSVVMSVFNGSATCVRAITSVLEQTLADFELLITDDCSSDGSWEVLQDAAKLDSRIRISRNTENVGYCRSYNRLISMAEGDIVALMDQDDRCAPDRLQAQLRWMERHDSCGLVTCFVDLVMDEMVPAAWQAYHLAWERQRRTLAGSPHLGRLQSAEPVTHGPEVVYRRALWEHVGGYRALLGWAGDGDLYLRIAERSEIAMLPEVLYHRTVSATGMTMSHQQLVAYSSALAAFDARLRRANIDADSTTITWLLEEFGSTRGLDAEVRRLLDLDPWSPVSDSHRNRQRLVAERISRLL